MQELRGSEIGPKRPSIKFKEMQGGHQDWVTIRDVHVTKIGGQWGVRVGERSHLCRASEERVVFEIAAAFIQLHHDEAGLGEGASEFLDRVGLDYVRERVVRHPELRGRLLARFMRQHRRGRDITRSDDIVLALMDNARVRAG